MTEEVQVVLHHGTILPCEAQGFPRPSIMWQREGVPIAAGNMMYNTSVLLTHLVSMTFMDTYLLEQPTLYSSAFSMK